MDLKDINEEYEKNMRLNAPSYEKNIRLANLKLLMEGKYAIPMKRKPEWESENRKVIALYRKISTSRTDV